MADVSDELRMFIVNERSHTVLEVGGELDLGSVGELRDRLQVVIESGTGDVLVDMSRVRFCDAGTLNAIVVARRRLEGAERGLFVVGPSAGVDRLLELCGLDPLVAVPAAYDHVAAPDAVLHRAGQRPPDGRRT